MQKLGQFHQFLGGLGIEAALTRVDQWELSPQQSPGYVGHITGVACAPYGTHRGVVDGVVHGRQGHIARHFQHHGRGPAGTQVGEGATHHLRDAFRRVDELGPLGDQPVVVHAGEVGGRPQLVRARLAWQHQHRRGIGVGLGDASEGVLNAGPGLHREHTCAPAVQRARVAVGHIHGTPLHSGYHRAYFNCRRCIDDGAIGEAEEELHSFLLQYFGDSIACFHCDDSSSSRNVAPSVRAPGQLGLTRLL